MPIMLNLAGQRFGYLIVLRLESNIAGRPRWRCLCDCGKEHVVKAQGLRSGSTSSCGCRNLEVARAAMVKRSTTHGLSKTRTYGVWCGIRRRCHAPAEPAYPYYGGRGITVCDRWRESFENFLADMGEMPPGMTLERIDNERGYEPDNCRWDTRTAQARNRRSNHLITHRGETKPISVWATETGVARWTIRRRLKAGVPIDQILP